MATLLTKAEAQALAKLNRSYYAKALRNTHGKYWGVWCAKSNHWVEFDPYTIDKHTTPQCESNS